MSNKIPNNKYPDNSLPRSRSETSLSSLGEKLKSSGEPSGSERASSPRIVSDASQGYLSIDAIAETARRYLLKDSEAGMAAQQALEDFAGRVQSADSLDEIRDHLNQLATAIASACPPVSEAYPNDDLIRAFESVANDVKNIAADLELFIPSENQVRKLPKTSAENKLPIRQLRVMNSANPLLSLKQDLSLFSGEAIELGRELGFPWLNNLSRRLEDSLWHSRCEAVYKVASEHKLSAERQHALRIQLSMTSSDASATSSSDSASSVSSNDIQSGRGPQASSSHRYEDSNHWEAVTQKSRELFAQFQREIRGVENAEVFKPRLQKLAEELQRLPMPRPRNYSDAQARKAVDEYVNWMGDIASKTKRDFDSQLQRLVTEGPMVLGARVSGVKAADARGSTPVVFADATKILEEGLIETLNEAKALEHIEQLMESFWGAADLEEWGELHSQCCQELERMEADEGTSRRFRNGIYQMRDTIAENLAPEGERLEDLHSRLDRGIAKEILRGGFDEQRIWRMGKLAAIGVESAGFKDVDRWYKRIS